MAQVLVNRPPDMNRYEFVAVCALRVQQLLAGGIPRLEGAPRATTMAQMEVVAGRVARDAGGDTRPKQCGWQRFGGIADWFRKGEILGRELRCTPYEEAGFREGLEYIQSLDADTDFQRPSPKQSFKTLSDYASAVRESGTCACRRRLPGAGDRVRKPQLDVRLSGHADSPGFTVDGAKQIDRKVDIHALHLTARPPRLVPVDMLVDFIRAGVEQLVELLSRNRATTFCPRTRVFRAPAPGGPR
jgi:hypothetical protein